MSHLVWCKVIQQITMKPSFNCKERQSEENILQTKCVGGCRHCFHYLCSQIESLMQRLLTNYMCKDWIVICVFYHQDNGLLFFPRRHHLITWHLWNPLTDSKSLCKDWNDISVYAKLMCFFFVKLPWNILDKSSLSKPMFTSTQTNHFFHNQSTYHSQNSRYI